MGNIRSVACFVIASLVASSAAVASDTAKVAWHTKVQDAWQDQQGRRPLLVFVTREDCFYCVQMNKLTYGNSAVAGAINQSFVALVIDVATPPCCAMKVTAFPTTFVISPQAVIVDRIEGFVRPEVLASRLGSVRSECKSPKWPKAVSRVLNARDRGLYPVLPKAPLVRPGSSRSPTACVRASDQCRWTLVVPGTIAA